jgi:hypothetical protein
VSGPGSSLALAAVSNLAFNQSPLRVWSAMHRVPAPEVLLRADQTQAALPLATEGVLRWVWESKYGPILIEVIDDRVFVNGELVEPHAGPGA